MTDVNGADALGTKTLPSLQQAENAASAWVSMLEAWIEKERINRIMGEDRYLVMGHQERQSLFLCLRLVARFMPVGMISITGEQSEVNTFMGLTVVGVDRDSFLALGW